MGLPPLLNADELSIKDQQVRAGMRHYMAGDSRAGGPSRHALMSWRWDGKHFVPGPVVYTQPASLDSYPVTVEGIGPIRVGMTEVEIERVLGRQITVGDMPDVDCGYVRPTGDTSGLGLMFIRSRFARVDVIPPSKAATRSGIRLGSTEDEVKRAYPGAITVERHPYDPSGHYLVYRPVSDTDRLMIFETDGKRVNAFRGGSKEAVSLIEGCV